MHLMSPSDIVGPSPVTSNGTETTEIEDEESEEAQQQSQSNRTSQPQVRSLLYFLLQGDELGPSSWDFVD